MTREEAIEVLNGILKLNYREWWDHKCDEAVDMAIEALSTPSGDLISRADAKQAIRDRFPNLADRLEINNVLNNVPSAEAVHGEWEHWGSPFSDESEVIDTIVCSVCGARFIEPKDEPKGEYNYCPNCGAKMNKGGDSE